MTGDKLRITYRGKYDKVINVDTCPYWDFKLFNDQFPNTKNRPSQGLGSCTHPLLNDEKIECHYGESEIHVPDNCPLKKSKLIQKIELV
jgi:hypothetical protein